MSVVDRPGGGALGPAGSPACHVMSCAARRGHRGPDGDRAAGVDVMVRLADDRSRPLVHEPGTAIAGARDVGHPHIAKPPSSKTSYSSPVREFADDADERHLGASDRAATRLDEHHLRHLERALAHNLARRAGRDAVGERRRADQQQEIGTSTSPHRL